MPTPVDLSPTMLLNAYASGAFPMTGEDGVTQWFTTDPRGVLPLEQFHCPKTLRQIVKQDRFEVRIDTAFEDVITACQRVERGPDSGGWIGDDLIRAYTHLHEIGFAHSVETYLRGELVGGLYGVAIGGAFFGESMFHHASNASKIALVHLVDRLRRQRFLLLDTQMVTRHMRQFGATEIPAEAYHQQLARAIAVKRQFTDGE